MEETCEEFAEMADRPIAAGIGITVY